LRNSAVCTQEKWQVRGLLIGLSSGMVGLALGWLTRPFIEGPGRSLLLQEVIHHARASEDLLLKAAAHQTIAHVVVFGLACALLGYVVARLTQDLNS
jgi:hypothetical protein